MGALAQMIYVLLGLIGFPVFAGGESGPGVLIGPTGGYLVGFVLGAYVTGRIAQKLRPPRLVWMAFATVLGLIPIYTLGEIGLWIWVRSSFSALVMAGVIPFLSGDIVKALLAAFVASRIHLRQLILGGPTKASPQSVTATGREQVHPNKRITELSQTAFSSSPIS